jgi:hypothetical protein
MAGDVGLYMGVGASGGDMRELESMLRASVEDGVFGLDRFGDAGLAAANPLFAFQLMNNFTLCHGAILAGLHGPNGAFFSRGAGTVTALREAAFAVASGDAPAALAGGADSALHPVTTAELGRAGWIARGLAPAEGAALLALATQAPPSGAACIRLARAEVHVARDRTLADVATAVLRTRAGEIDDGGAAGERSPRAIVICACEPAVGAALTAATATAVEVRGAEILDAAAVLGESLAAAPALGWVIACDWLREHEREREPARAIVLSAGIDGDLGVAELVAGPAP